MGTFVISIMRQQFRPASFAKIMKGTGRKIKFPCFFIPNRRQNPKEAGNS